MLITSSIITFYVNLHSYTRHYITSSAPLTTSVPGWATNNDTAATSCSACEAGRYSTEGNNAGADACEPCPTGQFQIASGQTGCNDCPLNQFQAEPGQYLCQVTDGREAEARATQRLSPPPPLIPTARTSTAVDENTTPRAGLRGDGRRRVRSRRGIVLLRHLPGDVLLTGRDRAVRALRRRLQQVRHDHHAQTHDHNDR